MPSLFCVYTKQFLRPDALKTGPCLSVPRSQEISPGFTSLLPTPCGFDAVEIVLVVAEPTEP